MSDKPGKPNDNYQPDKSDPGYAKALKKHQKDFGELYNADPNCWHERDLYNYSGIRCKKCEGWFCY